MYDFYVLPYIMAWVDTALRKRDVPVEGTTCHIKCIEIKPTIPILICRFQQIAQLYLIIFTINFIIIIIELL